MIPYISRLMTAANTTYGQTEMTQQNRVHPPTSFISSPRKVARRVIFHGLSVTDRDGESHSPSTCAEALECVRLDFIQPAGEDACDPSVLNEYDMRHNLV